MKRALVIAVLAACGGSNPSDSIGDIDARCTALCTSSEPTCSADVTTCEQECQLRVQNVQPFCATCLLEDSNGGECSVNQICCPSPEFPNSVLDCGSACADSAGVNPSNHPICADICASDDAACSTDAKACLDECNARVAGVSGLCALCLLDGANGGVCAGGQTCCPNPQFPRSVNDCASVCTN